MYRQLPVNENFNIYQKFVQTWRGILSMLWRSTCPQEAEQNETEPSRETTEEQQKWNNS